MSDLLPPPSTHICLPIYQRIRDPLTLRAYAAIAEKWIGPLENLDLGYWFFERSSLRDEPFPKLRRTFSSPSHEYRLGKRKSIHFSLHRILYGFLFSEQSSIALPSSLEELIQWNKLIPSCTVISRELICRPHELPIYNYLDENLTRESLSRKHYEIQARSSPFVQTTRPLPHETIEILRARSQEALSLSTPSDMARPGDTQEDLDIRANMHQHEKEWIGDILSKSSNAGPLHPGDLPLEDLDLSPEALLRASQSPPNTQGLSLLDQARALLDSQGLWDEPEQLVK